MQILPIKRFLRHEIVILENGKITGFDQQKNLIESNAFFKEVMEIQTNLEMI